MTIDALIMLAGGLVAVLPFLGLPSSWDTVLFFLLGVAVFALGVVVRRTFTGRGEKRPVIKNHTMFSESQPARHSGSDMSETRHDEAAS